MEGFKVSVSRRFAHLMLFDVRRRKELALRGQEVGDADRKRDRPVDAPEAFPTEGLASRLGYRDGSNRARTFPQRAHCLTKNSNASSRVSNVGNSR